MRYVVDELSTASDWFREFWPRGAMEHMPTYRAEPDSDTAKALDALRSLG